jgi:hypothetical protein
MGRFSRKESPWSPKAKVISQQAAPIVAKNSKTDYTDTFGGSKNEKKHFLANYFFSCIGNWINTIFQKESTRGFGVN